MPQITNSQLMDEVKQLKSSFGNLDDRVKRLEGKMAATDTAIEHITVKLNEISTKMNSFESNIVFWQRLGSFVNPIIAGTLVVLIQHFFFH